MNKAENGRELDDQGTDQRAAANVLRKLRDAGFDSSNEKLARALGRPTAEIEAAMDNPESIDGDVVMKARELAQARGIQIA